MTEQIKVITEEKIPDARREFYSLFQTGKDSGCLSCFCIFLLNVIATPFLLIGRSVQVFLRPCMIVTFYKCCLRCIICCFSDKFTDNYFPTNFKSLGSDEPAKWMRLSDMTTNTNKEGEVRKVSTLFDDVVIPYQICEKTSANCFILSAFVILCERPSFIQNCFINRVFNPRGKYKFYLYDEKKNDFVKVVIDDYVPMHEDGTLMFIKLHGEQIWPLMLQKAIAKHRTSYKAIENLTTLETIGLLTGYISERINLDRTNTNICDVAFKRFQYLFKHGCMLAAGRRVYDGIQKEDNTGNQILSGHAYSIIDIKTPMLTTSSIRLLKIRNPWGTFKWDGAWSKDSEEWKKHPGVSLMLGKVVDVNKLLLSNDEDSYFYITWEDFLRYFDCVDVVFPNSGVDEIHIKVNESHPYTGLVEGCLCGCANYWCLCKGLRVLWCQENPHKLYTELKTDMDKIYPLV